MNQNKLFYQIKEIFSGRESINAKNDNRGLSGFEKGQKVRGLVSSVSDGITISLQGYEITAPAGMFQGLSVGDTILFEVLSVTDSQIELSAADHKSIKNGKAAEAIVRLNTDRDVFLSRKEQEGKQTEREEEHRTTMKKIDNLLSRMTEKDFKVLEEEGFSVEDFTVSGLEAAITRLHSFHEEGAAGYHQPGGRENKNSFTAREIEQKLKDANLPAEADTVRKVMSALDISSSIGELDEAAMKHLIRMELPPSLENLYKAKYSKETSGKESQLSEETWTKLRPQVEEVIRAAGYEVNTENLNRARWLVENGLPLTKENFIYYDRLTGQEEFTDQSEVLDQILKEMGEGIAPKDAIVIPGLKDRTQKLTEKLTAVSEKEIRDAVRTEKEINIKLLTDKKYREEYLKEVQSEELTEKQQLETVRARRLLEEIRLKMTTEAAGALERKGFHIETQGLGRVVEELRQLEDSYYRRLFTEADLEADVDQINLLRETTRGMEQLKTVPSYVLGTTLASRKLMTIPGLVTEGSKLTEQLMKAKDAYESLLTEPNREYGDSIQKAFKNSGSLLSEMGLENTVYNQRAIRILGYNRMEITQENLERVKAYDLEVNTLMQKLHPAVAVRLIKEGINPMGIPIDELNQKIDQLREEQGITSDEKFSTFLRKLEKEDRIQKEERQAYIGIYRLLYRIDKTDGAALGAVIKADREVTLSNLLTAVRSLQKGAIDTVVDDSFGMLQSVSDREATITDQLNGVFGEDSSGKAPGKQEVTSGNEAKAEFMNHALKQLLSAATPEGLLEMQQKLYESALPAHQGSTESAPMLTSGMGIWETLKDVSAEKLFDLASAQSGEDAIYKEKLQELKQVYQSADQAVRFLEDFKVPCTTSNIMMAGQILNNSSTFFKKYFQLREENNKEISKNNLQEKEKLTDTLIDRDSAGMTYDQMEQEIKEVLEQESGSDRIDALRLTELKNMGAQMALMKTLAKKEFYQIPIETGKGITNMNLTIVRGTGSAGKVTVSLVTQALGKVKADISLKDRTLNGYIASDSRRGAELLTGNLQGIREMLKEEDITVKQLEVCYDRFAKDNYTYQNQESGTTDGPGSAENERLLYRIARSMVLAVSAADASGKQMTAIS